MTGSDLRPIGLQLQYSALSERKSEQVMTSDSLLGLQDYRCLLNQ